MATYALSDLHGCLHFYKQIKEFLQPEDKVYFLGDAGDRGPEPWKTITAIANDPQFIYIKGNHEDMLVNALIDYYDFHCTDWSLSLLAKNGGLNTFNQAIQDPQGRKWAKRINAFPTHLTYTNPKGEIIELSHAGFTPWKDDWYNDEKMRLPSQKDLVWDRTHFFDDWNEKDCFDRIIVHGHTPILHLINEIYPSSYDIEVEPGAFWYDNDHKVCIDCGAVFTDYCVLLNLDDWTEHIFYLEK